MRLKCIKPFFYWWGTVFHPGKFYDGELKLSRKNLIVDSEQYFFYLRKIASSEAVDLARDGWSQDKIKGVIPDYLTLTEIKDRFTITLDFPFVSVVGDDGTIDEFCLLNLTSMDDFLTRRMVSFSDSDREKVKRYIDRSVSELKFDVTVNMLDEWFVDVEEIRDRKLQDLGI